MNTQEIQMDGFTYEVLWTHVGQYRPYGDFFRVAEIRTTNRNPNTILEIMKTFYGYNVPLKKDWDNTNWDAYFRGYCEIESIPGGFKYTKCEPYDD